MFARFTRLTLRKGCSEAEMPGEQRPQVVHPFGRYWGSDMALQAAPKSEASRMLLSAYVLTQELTIAQMPAN